MEAVRSCEKLIPIYSTRRHHIPKDRNLGKHRYKNLKYHGRWKWYVGLMTSKMVVPISRHNIGISRQAVRYPTKNLEWPIELQIQTR
jgi:hypothetical protein